jgi:hypothetical protein
MATHFYRRQPECNSGIFHKHPPTMKPTKPPRAYKRHPARQVTMRASETLPLEALHPDWPFDGSNSTHEESTTGHGAIDTGAAKIAVARASTARNTARKVVKPRRAEFNGHESATSPSAEEKELDRQLSLLTAPERSKLYRYAAQELHRVPQFEPEEGSAALGRACRHVMRKLRTAGLTLNDIEDEG